METIASLRKKVKERKKQQKKDKRDEDPYTGFPDVHVSPSFKSRHNRKIIQPRLYK